MAWPARRFIRSRPFVVAVALVVAVGGGATWLLTRGSSDAQAATRTVVTVSSQTVSQTVSTTGTIEPAHEADLSFAVSGTVTGVDVAVGDKVTKGQALATVGRSSLKAAVSVAKASLTSAEESLTSTESSGSAVQIASAKAQVAAAKSSLTSAKDDLADATLRSTITGTVATVSIDKGDTAGSGSGATGASSGSTGSTSSSSSSGSSADIVVISTSSWIVNASVGSSDLGSVKKGLQATITPTDSTTKVFGTVQSVGIVASSDSSSSATFPVVIAVTGSPTGLYAGGSASVTITVKQVTGVITVPTAALHSSGGATFVYQMKSGKQVTTDVTVGTTYGASTQITKGLASGDQVVVTTVAPTRTGTSTGSRSGSGSGFGGGTGGFGGGTGGPPSGTGGAGGGGNG